jgi:hypothetical protein
MKKIFIIMITALIYMTSGCKEEGQLYHVDDSIAAPAVLTINGEPVSKPGGAVIKYTVPKDNNLMGVKAVYERNGEVCETKASLYTDSLTVEGFGDTNPHEVKLYSIGRNGKLSEPVSIQITPLTPAVFSSSVTMESAFGGVAVNLAGNDSRANLSLVLLRDTVGTGEWTHVQTFYTQAVAMRFACRDLKPNEQTFALYIRDRWNNMSDTLVEILTPLEEMKIPKINPVWENARLPTDTYGAFNDEGRYALEGAWDDGVNVYYAGKMSQPMPQHFTINLKRKVIVNRFQLFPRQAIELYSGAAPRTFELWGSDDPPRDGSFDNWYKLGEWEQLKPSGYGEDSEVGEITPEDTEYFRTNGGNYEVVPTESVPNPYIVVSYLRFRTTASFGTYGTEATTGQTLVGELTFYGQVIEE